MVLILGPLGYFLAVGILWFIALVSTPPAQAVGPSIAELKGEFVTARAEAAAAQRGGDYAARTRGRGLALRHLEAIKVQLLRIPDAERPVSVEEIEELEADLRAGHGCVLDRGAPSR
jgi:hypothetical protein